MRFVGGVLLWNPKELPSSDLLFYNSKKELPKEVNI
jgi:hypothetical protein